MKSLQANRSTKTVIAANIGFAACLLASPMARSADNPFVSEDLQIGYMVAEKAAEGRCGEGKCGANKQTGAEGQSNDTDKAAEGKCGANKGKRSDESHGGEAEG